jgi:hypothetical protein
MVVAPSLKVTVPLGDAPVTVAVSKVGLPKTTGFTLELNVTELEKTLTVWVSAADVAPALLMSPA